MPSLLQRCYIGCPVWACEGWVGSLYSTKERRKWLSEYSQVFHTVEGNSTFYALPTLDTVERWADETQPGFKFSLKFPRVITHDAQLQFVDSETRSFLDALSVLQNADRLGPSFLQLPPRFSGERMAMLEKYLQQLPREMSFAVEVRHLDFVQNREYDERLNEVLYNLGMDRVVFDSRALFSATPSDPYESESQRRKPNLPVRAVAIGKHPMVRFVGRNRVDDAQPWIDYWTPIVAEWIEQGKTPYVFLHSPDDLYAPEFARKFANELRLQTNAIPKLPELWPGQKVKRQRDLF